MVLIVWVLWTVVNMGVPKRGSGLFIKVLMGTVFLRRVGLFLVVGEGYEKRGVCSQF